MLAVRVVAALAGLALALTTVLSAIKTVVVPRVVTTRITRAVFIGLRRLFDRVARPSRPFLERDRVMALYAPLALIALAATWVLLVIVGFTGVEWGLRGGDAWSAFRFSGSSALTLGFVTDEGVAETLASFAEAVMGLGLLALLISYLPAIYGAFAKREATVALLEVRAGIPPSPSEMLTRYGRIRGLDEMDVDLFPIWEQWFVEVEESHTSLPSLVFFRSPQPGRSWVTAAGCVLDSAALLLAAVDRPASPRAQLCLRSGFLALRRICDGFSIGYDPAPAPDDPISITRAEFETVLDELDAVGLPLRSDRDQAWRDFAGWRVNYDTVLAALAALTMAPPARWITDRPLPVLRIRIRRPRHENGSPVPRGSVTRAAGRR